MLERGYIRIPRALFDSAEWREKRVYSHFEAILSLYEQAAYTQGRSVNLKGIIVTLNRGQLVTTIRLLADLWSWSKSTVSRFLHDLRDNNRDSICIEIGTINGTGATLITICNYDGNANEVVVYGTTNGRTNGTECGTTNGTAIYIENKDYEIQYKKEHTHILIELFTKSCASVHKERNNTFALYTELANRGCFEKGGDCYQIGIGMRLIGYMWSRFKTLQSRMTFPLTLHQANTICEKYAIEDIVKVLERMANTVDLEKQRKSIYHTLEQWLLTDFDRKSKSETAKKHIYPATWRQ